MPENQQSSGNPTRSGAPGQRGPGSSLSQGSVPESGRDTADIPASPLRVTPLHALHRRLAAQMAAFAGYNMPIQYDSDRYPGGILAEHRFTRASAGLFDVSHMGPVFLRLSKASGDAATDWAALAAWIERVFPSDIVGLAPGDMRYTHLLDPHGGVLDDLIVARLPDNRAYIVVNAAMKTRDFALFAEVFGEAITLDIRAEDALVALQGPEAESLLVALIPGIERLTFMQLGVFTWSNAPVIVSRSGYTGEDGFEILIPGAMAETFAETLLADPRVRMIGLGARDSLRLEAGLCLYGHDLSPERTPISAGLKWIIQKRRRMAADFPGAARILDELARGPAEMLVGLVLLEPGLPREGAPVQKSGGTIGMVTSGGFGASLNDNAGGAIALAYVEAAFAVPGTEVEILLRNKPRAARVTALPFVPHRYKRAR